MVAKQQSQWEGGENAGKKNPFRCYGHRNGVSWRSYRDVTVLASGCYGGLAMKNNIAITTGHNGSYAVVTIGRRN
jgi:hypothetical protein